MSHRLFLRSTPISFHLCQRRKFHFFFFQKQRSFVEFISFLHFYFCSSSYRIATVFRVVWSFRLWLLAGLVGKGSLWFLYMLLLLFVDIAFYVPIVFAVRCIKLFCTSQMENCFFLWIANGKLLCNFLLSTFYFWFSAFVILSICISFMYDIRGLA